MIRAEDLSTHEHEDNEEKGISEPTRDFRPLLHDLQPALPVQGQHSWLHPERVTQMSWLSESAGAFGLLRKQTQAQSRPASNPQSG